jgi:CubicO group peptidase (beta-lactamase class C family)
MVFRAGRGRFRVMRGDGQTIFLRLIAVALVGGCALPDAAFADDELPRATPESQGMSSKTLRRMSEVVRSKKLDVRSMIVLRKGRVVLEWYAGGVTRDHDHNIFSITKSVVGTLTGIAIDEGKLSGVGMTLGEAFPDVKGVKRDAIKAGVRLDDLLTMRSGFPCARGNEPSGPERKLFDRIHRAPDRMEAILDLEMLRRPGDVFSYGNVAPQLMLGILEAACGQKAMALSEAMLFGPLGFRGARWEYPDETGLVSGGYGLRLRAIDLAKLGQLYLQRGKWDGKQVVSEQWIEAATSNRTGSGYGYYWWTGLSGSDGRAFAAKGVHGQQIYVDPDRDLVFVVTAEFPPGREQELLAMLTQKYVIGSVQSDRSLGSNAGYMQALKAELAKAATYVPDSRRKLPKVRVPQL